MIKVDNVTKRYGDKTVVDGVTFEVQEGEIVGFLGRNGAGKTTTMNILTGYISSTFGTCSVDGYDILKDPLEVKKRIGYLPEQPPLYMDMTIREYLGFVCNLKSIPRKEWKRQMDEVCELVGISDMQPRMIRNLSKGYKQRVGLAQALLGNPEVLILDEPTVGLDPRQIIEIRQLVRQLGRSHTIILSSHILSEVSEVCQRVVIIEQGRLVAQDSLENLTKSTGNVSRMVVRVQGADNTVRKAIMDLRGVKYVETNVGKEPNTMDYMIESDKDVDVREDVFRAMARINKPILQMRPMDVTLEDVFIQLTSGVGEEV